MNPWSQLPNADHIDWAIESFKKDRFIWGRAYNKVWGKLGNRNSLPPFKAMAAAGQVFEGELWDEVWSTFEGVIGSSSWHATYESAGCTIAALLFYDDCDQYLAMTYEQLKVWAELSERPQAVLLLPMKWVQENEVLSNVTA